MTRAGFQEWIMKLMMTTALTPTMTKTTTTMTRMKIPTLKQTVLIRKYPRKRKT